MVDGSELHRDLLLLIVRRINLIEDYLSFGSVCKSWNSVATKDNFNSSLPRVPWLMLAEDKEDNTCRKFFSLSNGMILKKRIPEARGSLIHIIGRLPPWIDGKYYIVESLGSLFVVSQDGVDLRYVKDDWGEDSRVHILGEDDEGKDVHMAVSSHIMMVFPSVVFVLQFGSHQLCVEHPLIHQIQLHLLMFIRFLRILPRSADV
ncbi:hypothetical protein HAX54_008952 [Datura stramonium]|uniref:F-box domain-containing protein n=1 Tax=Datura stramonium TaxID=4076 RepID=A0ABS8RWA8_DATST|nr:hypothetical protein [Datura stramonium]